MKTTVKPQADPTSKREERYFMEKKEVGMKVHRRKAGVLGDDSFSLAESQGV